MTEVITATDNVQEPAPENRLRSAEPERLLSAEVSLHEEPKFEQKALLAKPGLTGAKINIQKKAPRQKIRTMITARKSDTITVLSTVAKADRLPESAVYQFNYDGKHILVHLSMPSGKSIQSADDALPEKLDLPVPEMTKEM